MKKKPFKASKRQSKPFKGVPDTEEVWTAPVSRLPKGKKPFGKKRK